jgi:hypothetical protein
VALTTALLVVVAGVAGSSSPAAAGDPVPVEFRVVDRHGQPFPPGSAGMFVRTAPDAPLITGVDDDGDGDAVIHLDPDATYSGNAFAANTGCRDPDFVLQDGTTLHWATTPITDATAASLSGTTFVVVKPTGRPSWAAPLAVGVAVEVRVVDEDGQPFVPGTAGALFSCVQESCTPDTWFGNADADGIVRVVLDPRSPYEVGGQVSHLGTGCVCGAWPSDTADPRFWFSANKIDVPSGAALHRRTEPLVIFEPSCPPG